MGVKSLEGIEAGINALAVAQALNYLRPLVRTGKKMIDDEMITRFVNEAVDDIYAKCQIRKDAGYKVAMKVAIRRAVKRALQQSDYESA